MKKTLAAILAFVVCLALCACATSQTPDTTETAKTTPPEIRGVLTAIEDLKKHLKNPNSLVLISIEYLKRENANGPDGPERYYYMIEYTAENSFGGHVREKAYYQVGVGKTGCSWNDISELEWKTYKSSFRDLIQNMDIREVEKAMG